MRQCTATYGAVSRHMSTQDTADANYMLFTIAVNSMGTIALPSVAAWQCRVWTLP